MGNIGIGKDEVAFVIEESTLGGGGTITSSDAVLVVGEPSFKQDRLYTNDEQKRMTVSKLSRGSYAFDVGQFSMEAYIKPSGSLGVAPVPAKLLKGLFGKETISAGTSVKYTLAGISDNIITDLIVFKQGNIVFWNFGCVIDKGEFPIVAEAENSLGRGTFTGFFLKQLRAGVSKINNAGGYNIGDTDIKVDDGAEYEAGTRIEISDGAGGWVDNGGAGHLISAVDTTTNTITIDALLQAVADDAEVRGWVPDITEAGVLVSGRLGTAYENTGGGDAQIKIANANISISNNIKVLNDEKTATEYPESIIRASDREVEVSYEMYFRKDTGHIFYDASTQNQRSMKLPAGDTAGKRYQFNLPIVELNTPDLNGNEELRLGITGVAFATSAYDNEIELEFA